MLHIEWFERWQQEKPEKAMAHHSGTLAWKIPWTEEPGGLQSMGSLRVGHDWLHFHFSLSSIGEGNGNPLQCSCLENPRNIGAWWAALYGVAPSRTRLKWLSSSSNKRSRDTTGIRVSPQFILGCFLILFLFSGVNLFPNFSQLLFSIHPSWIHSFFPPKN